MDNRDDKRHAAPVGDPKKPGADRGMGSGTEPSPREEGRSAPAPASGGEQDDFLVVAPSVSVPKGGGAIRGIGEKFQANPVTGTAGLTVPIAVSPGRGGMQPQLALSYDSGAGNGPFGHGWRLPLASIRRKTDKGLPQYRDGGPPQLADVFVFSEAEDLVPIVDGTSSLDAVRDETIAEDGVAVDYRVVQFRPRVEGAFSRIEQWTRKADGRAWWRTVSRTNTERIYGRSDQARVCDPDAPARCFEWLLEQEADEVGNVTVYEYKPEDRAGVASSPAETARTLPGNSCTYRYPKRIRYGNTAPFVTAGYSQFYTPVVPPASQDFHFEVVFDYGEHDAVSPMPDDDLGWPARLDPHSSFRAGFDLRCYRLCQRVLVFHRFSELGTEAVLVRSTEFDYQHNPHLTKLVSVTARGWRTDGVQQTSLLMPPVTFTYSEPVIAEALGFVSGLEDLPFGFDASRWQWVDLDGEGMAGLLTEQGEGWFYKRNEGQGALGAAQRLQRRPTLSLADGGTLMDLDGDGRLDLVHMSAPLAGSQQRKPDGSWGVFRPFDTVPDVDPSDPNVRLVDLDGDGHADLLVTEDQAFRWYRSRARDGFEAPERIARGADEARGPVLVFASDAESLFLADMTGDGLADLVRVRHSSVCYWPNRGYGRFGAKVVLSGCPLLDTPARFDPGRVRLSDVDGSGPADLVYVGPDAVRVWLNQSGNGFGPPTVLRRIAGVHDAAVVTTADVLGDGTACLLWSSALLSDQARPLRYLRLMADGKPHLLTGMDNGLGRQTRLTYAPSTKFYLADRRAGRPWATRLHFPVQVLERVEVYDGVTGWRFASTYAYHHGSYDGAEREFRGFGLVEQSDTESFADFEAAAPAGSVTSTPTMRVTTYELGPGAFVGTSYALVLQHALSENYFVLIDGLVASSPQAAGSVGVRVTADPHGTGSLGTSSADDVLELTRGDSADGDWVGTVTVVECLTDAATDGFVLVDVLEVSASSGGASSPQATAVSANTSWSDLSRVVLYGGPRGGGSTVASGDDTVHNSLFGKLQPSGTDAVTLTRHGGGVALLAAQFCVYVVQWGTAHRIERVEVTGSTGALGFDAQSIPGSAVTRSQTWLWGSGFTEDNDAASSFLGLLLALGDGTNENSTESQVAVGCKAAVARDVLLTVHQHPQLSVQWYSRAEATSTLVEAYAVDAPLSAETYGEVGPVKHTAGRRLALQTASHDATAGELERVRFGVRPRSDTVVEARRTEAQGAWAARLAVVDFGGLSSTVARDNPQVAYYRPPVRTRTWFHTGVWQTESQLEDAYAAEYWAGDASASVIGRCLYPDGLSPVERRQAARALKGRVLRQEVYADDGTAAADKPYTVTANRYAVRLLQPLEDNRFASFLVVPHETMSWQYERTPDPRVGHQLTLAVDEYGEVVLVAAVGYPRRGTGHEPEQLATLVSITERQLIHDDANDDQFHLALPAVERLWELTGVTATDSAPLTVSGLLASFEGAAVRAYEASPGIGVEKRKLSEARTLYWGDGLTAALSLGTVGARALVYERYQLAFPVSWLPSALDGHTSDALLLEAGYVQLDGTDTDWWRPSGRSALDAAHFFLPTTVTDPWSNTTSITWDTHDLLVESVTDALGNVVSADHDYQVLGPWRVTDPNANQQEVAFDALGRVVATAVVGRLGEGDTLTDPTSTVTYELDRWSSEGKPARAVVQTREVHADSNSRWQVVVTYSDGGGNAVLTKHKAAPGEAPLRDGNGELVFDDDGELVLDWVQERWVGSGRVVVDNKGNPVKQYEPFFSATSEYEDEVQLVEWGVSPELHYDPLGRKVRTDHPDGTFEVVIFDAWTQESWDRCDTVEESAWYDARAGASDPLVQRSVGLSALNKDTPTTAHTDVLGRTFLTKEMPDQSTTIETRLALDLLGRVLSVTDARGNITQTDDYDALGRSVHTDSPDAGETWLLFDLAGQPVRTWKTGDLEVRATYDALRRPVALHVTEGLAAERLHVYTVYGEFLGTSAGQAANALGRVWRQYDGAGRVQHAYDFEGNVLSSNRVFLDDVDTEVDWAALTAETTATGLDTADAGDLQSASYETTTTWDALGRPVTATTPDDSVTRRTYDEAGLLAAVDVQVRGDSAWTPFVRSIYYNARGQRTAIVYSENAGATDGAFTTAYTYDPLTFRITRLRTVRESDAARLQDLAYTYDAVGNIVQITDSAQQTLFFDNAVVSPTTKYVYDALYRLVSAEGREHGSLGQPGHQDPVQGDLPHDNDGSTVRTYLESYVYDEVGNIVEMKHQGGTEASPGTVLWRRFYDYAATSNRLLSTSQPGDTQGSTPYTDTYVHSDRGAMTAMPHLPGMGRQFDDQLRAVDLGSGDDAVYHYDAAGQRVRKVVRRGANTEERLYIGGVWEIYRKSTSSGLQEERETLHVMDDQRRVAMVETLTVDGGSAVGAPMPRLRLLLDNHLGNTALEVDEAGVIISYEEFHPYGTTSWWASNGSTEVSTKRYRYTAKEKDEETGLANHGARYYAPWLARWDRADPAGAADGPNRCAYVKGNPVNHWDPTGGFSLFVQLLTTSAQAPTEPESPPPPDPRMEMAVAKTRHDRFVEENPDAPIAGAGPDGMGYIGSQDFVPKANRVPAFEAAVAAALPGAAATAIVPDPMDFVVAGLAGRAARSIMPVVEQKPPLKGSYFRPPVRFNSGRIVGMAGRTDIPWHPNPAGTIRTEADIPGILRKYGINVPDYVQIKVADDLVPEGADAVYLTPQGYRQSTWTWDDLIHPKTQKVAVKIRSSLLESDEAIVSTVAHEIHEIRGLWDAFEDAGELTSQQLKNKIDALHNQALEMQKNLHDRWVQKP